MRNAFLLKRYLKECNYNFRLVKTNYRYSTKKSLADTKKKFLLKSSLCLTEMKNMIIAGWEKCGVRAIKRIYT